MRAVNPPDSCVRHVVGLCADSIRDAKFAKRLVENVEALESHEVTFDGLGRNAELFAFPSGVNSVGLTSEELVWLYNQKLVGPKSAARKIYDKIRGSSSVCPFCNHRESDSIDHYLPKEEFPVVAITPINLVPACLACNKKKQEFCPKSKETQLLHPYFDNVEAICLLKATVDAGAPPAVIYSVDAPDDCDPVLAARAAKHFEFFGLAYLYASQAGRELSQIDSVLLNLAESGGPSAVRAHLVEQAQSRSSAEVNSWQAALYRALVESSWFWNGGHRKIRCRDEGAAEHFPPLGEL